MKMKYFNSYLFLFLIPLVLNGAPIKEGVVFQKPSDLGVGRLMPTLGVTSLATGVAQAYEFKKNTLTVVLFTSQSCPVAKKLIPDIEALQKKYAAKNIAWLMVNPYLSEDTNQFKKMDFLKNGKVTLAFDKDLALAKRLGARTTTEVYLIDEEGSLLYRGALSDQYGLAFQLEKPTHRLLDAAIEASLKGQVPVIRATTAPGCSLDTGHEVLPDEVGLSYHERISRVVKENCSLCHRDSGVAPFSLDSKEQVLEHAGMIKKVLLEKRMPPWFAEAAGSNGPLWLNDRSLGEKDLLDFMKWLETKEEGPKNVALKKPQLVNTEWVIGKPDVIYTIPKVVTVKASGTMPYQHLFVRTDFPVKKWVNAWEVIPTAREVVHHVLIFAIPAKDATPEALKKRSRGGEMGGFFAAYVPGNSDITYPEDQAIGLEPGTVLYFQIHYTPNGQEQKDQTKLGLKFVDQPPLHEVKVAGVVNSKLKIPPQEANHHEVAELKLPEDVVILGYMPHMHLRGKAFKYTVTDPEHTVSTLLNVPIYDFNWQLNYRLASPLTLKKGSIIKVEAIFDNSPANLANPDPTATVKWGMQSSDEMLIGYFEYYSVNGNQSSVLLSVTGSEAEGTDKALPTSLERSQELMKQLDLDANGKLTKEELGKSSNPKAYLKYFDLMDSNHDKEVSLDELKAGLEKLKK